MDARVLWPRSSFINHSAEMKRLFPTSGRGRWPQPLLREVGVEVVVEGRRVWSASLEPLWCIWSKYLWVTRALPAFRPWCFALAHLCTTSWVYSAPPFAACSDLCSENFCLQPYSKPASFFSSPYLAPWYQERRVCSSLFWSEPSRSEPDLYFTSAM